MKKNVKRWLFLAGSLLFLALIILNLRRSPEWRHFDWARTWASIAHANAGFLLLAVLAVYASYGARAFRWKVFVDPMKVSSVWVSFVGQVLGFSSVYLVGRAGEFVRPAYIAKKERLPMTSMLAVWLVERVFDSVFLLLLLSAALSFLPQSSAVSQDNILLRAMRQGGQVMLGFMVLVVPALVLFRLRTDQLIAVALRLLAFLPERFQHRIQNFFRSFANGLGVVRHWKDFAASVFWTALLWVLNTSVFWLVFKSQGKGLGDLSWLASAPVLFCASLGLLVQFPGIGGGYQVGIVLALTELFLIPGDIATGAAILIWLIMSVPCIILGLGLSAYEGISIRKLEALTSEERATAGKSI